MSDSPSGIPSDLRATAEAASPGPWRNDFHKEQDHSNASYVTSVPLEAKSDGANDVMDFAVVGSVWYDGPNTVILEENAAFIAAANPAAILALLDENAALRSSLASAARDSERMAEITEAWVELRTRAKGECAVAMWEKLDELTGLTPTDAAEAHSNG